MHNKIFLSQLLLHLESGPLIAPLNVNFFALLLNYSLGIPVSFQNAKKKIYFFSIFLDTQSAIWHSQTWQSLYVDYCVSGTSDLDT